MDVKKLSPTQINILDSIDIDIFAKEIAGEMVKDASFDIVFKEGIQTTGLTKLYFEALDPILLTFADDIISEKAPLLSLIFGGKVKDQINASRTDSEVEYVYQATHEHLKGNTVVRKKNIALTFCTELLKYATPEQLIMLKNELTSSDDKETLTTLLGKQRHKTHDSFVSFFTKKPREPEHFTAYRTILESEIVKKPISTMHDGM